MLDCNLGEKQTQGMNPIISLASSSSSFLTAHISMGADEVQSLPCAEEVGAGVPGAEVSVFCGTE